MKKSELKQIIKEEYAKLLTEKFQSKTLGQLSNLLGSGKWSDGKKLFTGMAAKRGFDWANTPEEAITKSSAGNSNPNFISIYIVNSEKRNTTSKGGNWRLDKGLLGITVGNKVAGFAGFKSNEKSNRAGADYSNKGISNFKQMNLHADVVYTIDTTKIPSTTDLTRERAESKKGATALLKARDVANANHRRYKTALTMKVAATGAEGMEKLMAQAAQVVQQVIDKNTEMLKKGKYQTSWDTYKTVTDRYSRMVDSYVRYKQEFASMEKDKANAPDDSDNWRRDYVAVYMKEIKDYYTDMLKKAKIVNDGEYRDIVKA